MKKLAWLELARHRAGTALAVLSLGLTIGCAGMLYRLNLLNQSRFSTLAAAGDAIVGAKSGATDLLLGCLNLEGPYPGFIPYRLYVSLVNQRAGFGEETDAGMRQFKLVIPFLYCAKYRGHRVVGTSEAFLRQPGNPVRLSQGHWPGADEILLGASVAASGGGDGKSPVRVGESIEVQTWSSDQPEAQSVVPHHYKVAGILASMGNAWDGGLFLDIGAGVFLLASGMPTKDPVWGIAVLNYMLIYLEPGGMDFLRVLVDQRTVAQSVSIPAAREALERIAGTGRAMGLGVAGMIFLIGSISLAGLTMGRYEEKSRTLAVLKAMGYSRRRLRALLAWEGVYLWASAWVVGAGLDAGVFPGLRALLGKGLPSPDLLPSHVWYSWPIWILTLPIIMLSYGVVFARAESRHPGEALQGLS